MIIVDRALQARHEADDPVRFAMIGSGFMGRGIINQAINSTPGMDLVAVANRNPATAEQGYREAGVTEIERPETAAQLEAAIEAGRHSVTDDPSLLCQAAGIDAIVEVTGTIEHAARYVLEAFEHGKHVILMNAELDGTVGSILASRADKAGVVLTACDGDQPGVEGNLVRFVKGLGLTPRVLGNIKGLQDEYRNPTTQQGFAEQWGQNVHMVTSFADGTKISFEQAIVANAFGAQVPRRGMYGHDWDGHIDDAVELYDIDELTEKGTIVDYVVKAKPGPGVYVFATHDDPRQQHYLNLYKLGEGPLYSFYTPYHLCHFEVPFTVARAVLFDDAALAPADGPMVDVVTTAKTDLAAGKTLDGLGGYDTYGVAENYPVSRADDLLPIGLAEGCTLVNDVAKDQVLTYADVTVPDGRLGDRLRSEQNDRWPG